MNKGIDELLSDSRFIKYILNPIQGDDKYWESWINANDENQQLFNEASSLIKDLYEPLTPDEFQTQAIDFKRKIDISDAEKSDIVRLYDQRRPSGQPWLKIAATIIFIATIGMVAAWYINFTANQENLADSSSIKLIKKEVGRGQKLTVTFQDGTQVKLNSESYIVFPEDFESDKREVTLCGEAYFNVTHDTHRPFIVNTQIAETKVLGTSFNISAYECDSAVEIALVDGSVKVLANGGKEVQLYPNEKASIDKKAFIQVTRFNVEQVTGWKDNKIVFEKASLDEIQKVLERWYDVQFIFNSKPEFEGGYTGDFTNESLKEVLEGMSSNKFSYQIDGKKIYIN